MKLSEKIYNFALSNYKQVPPDKVINAEFSLSNSACHYNSVAAVRAGRADKVWLVWGGRGNGVVHFINSKNGVFFDETWHDDSDKSCYRIIREVEQFEYDNIADLLSATKRSFIFMFGNFYHRTNVDRLMHKLI